MKRVFLLTLLTVLFFACDSTNNAVAEAEDETSVSPTHVAVIEVEGMMCQKGCGAIIRKGLYETGGVSEVEVSFNEENPMSEIKVYFDINKTTTEKMLSVIGGLADMRYTAKLKKVTESKIVMHNSTSKENTIQNLKSVPATKASAATFSLPDLTKLLNNLIR